jgi:hypothetical protein
LLLVEIGDGGGGMFDCAVGRFKCLAEVIPAEVAGVKSGDDFLHFLLEGVVRDEVRHVEDFSEIALGEDVPDIHLLDGDVGVERAATKGTKSIKVGDELLVGLAFLFDEVFQAFAKPRNFVFEPLHGLFPIPRQPAGRIREEVRGF